MDASQDRGSTKIEPRGAICLVQWPQLALLLECATVLCVCACMICVVCGLNISAASEFVKNKGQREYFQTSRRHQVAMSTHVHFCTSCSLNTLSKATTSPTLQFVFTDTYSPSHEAGLLRDCQFAVPLNVKKKKH